MTGAQDDDPARGGGVGREVSRADAQLEASEQPGSTLKRRNARRRSIAVTGANTFLGRNIVGVLEEDDSIARIVVIDVKNPTTAGPKTAFYDVDLTQPAVESRIAEILNAEQVDTLVHL